MSTILGHLLKENFSVVKVSVIMYVRAYEVREKREENKFSSSAKSVSCRSIRQNKIRHMNRTERTMSRLVTCEPVLSTD